MCPSRQGRGQTRPSSRSPVSDEVRAWDALRSVLGDLIQGRVLRARKDANHEGARDSVR